MQVEQILDPLQRLDLKRPQLSPLRQAQLKVKPGVIVEACPFGCTVDHKDYDKHGYCRHLVGFTMDKKYYEPMKRDPSRPERRKVVVELVPDPFDVVPGDELGVRKMIPKLPKVDKRIHKLVQITTCWRVYEDRDTPDIKAAVARRAQIEEELGGEIVDPRAFRLEIAEKMREETQRQVKAQLEIMRAEMRAEFEAQLEAARKPSPESNKTVPPKQ